MKLMFRRNVECVTVMRATDKEAGEKKFEEITQTLFQEIRAKFPGIKFDLNYFITAVELPEEELENDGKSDRN